LSNDNEQLKNALQRQNNAIQRHADDNEQLKNALQRQADDNEQIKSSLKQISDQLKIVLSES
jgi:hypothetical protein